MDLMSQFDFAYFRHNILILPHKSQVLRQFTPSSVLHRAVARMMRHSVSVLTSLQSIESLMRIVLY